MGNESKFITRPEELIMLAVWHLEGNAYLVTIREFLTKMTGKEWSVGAIYVPLDRLSKLGYVEGTFGGATAERGGRSKKYYTLTKAGVKALGEIQRVHQAMWQGIPKIGMEGGSTA